MVWTRSKQETLALPVSALALLILGDYKTTSGWNWNNWVLDSKSNGTAADQQVQDALAEGWAWLMAHGLVMRDTAQTSADALKVTRLGHETLQYGLAAVSASPRVV